MQFQLGVTLRRVANQQQGEKKFDTMINKSIGHLKKATELKAQDATAFNNLGLSLFEAKKYEEAIECYTKAIVFESQEVKENRGSEDSLSYYYKNKGLAHYHRQAEGDYDQAKQDYDMSIEKNPDNADNYFNLGNVNLTEGEFTEAHKNFDIAIDKERLNAKYYHAKGLAF